MSELIRIPIHEGIIGESITENVRALPSEIGESGAVGKRHFQFSIVTRDPSSTLYMQKWDPNSIQVEVKLNSKLVDLKPTSTPFYAHSQTVNGPTGLQFDPILGELYQVKIKILSNPFPKNSTLVLAPNWDNPSFIKDQAVGAMIGKTISKALGWLQYVLLLALAGCGGMLFSYSKGTSIDQAPR